MACDDVATRPYQDGIGEAEAPNAAGNLGDLRVAVGLRERTWDL
jgi:hypothetical protein